MSDVLTPRHLHDLGKFLLALVMVWAYFSFSQFLIIWAGNLPEEIPVVPHAAQRRLAVRGARCWCSAISRCRSRCCSRAILKRNFKLLASIAIFILACASWICTGWWRRSFRKAVVRTELDGFHRPCGLVGLWLAYFLTQLEKRPLMPLNDPHLEEALEHGRE